MNDFSTRKSSKACKRPGRLCRSGARIVHNRDSVLRGGGSARCRAAFPARARGSGVRLRRAAGFRNVRRSAVILRKRGVLAWRQNDEALRGVGSEGFAGGAVAEARS